MRLRRDEAQGVTGSGFTAAAGALGVLACALAGLLFFEYRGTAGEEVAPAAPGVVRSAPPAVRTAPDTAAQAATTLGRPLFEPSRRPPGGGDAAVADLPRLTGVLVSGAGRVALFAGPGGRGLTVAAGGTLGPFTVRAVEPGQVVIDGPSGTRVLRPSFEGARTAVEAPPPAPVSIRNLLRDGAPAYPPTPGLLPLLGAAGQPRPAPDNSNQVPLADLLGAPPGIGVPGLQPGMPGTPPPAPAGPR